MAGHHDQPIVVDEVDLSVPQYAVQRPRLINLEHAYFLHLNPGISTWDFIFLWFGAAWGGGVVSGCSHEITLYFTGTNHRQLHWGISLSCIIVGNGRYCKN
jgi:hypothetical protein